MSTPYAEMPAPGHGELGVYLHVPFCLRKCPYCSFFSIAGKSELYNRYAQAVAVQLQGLSQLAWSREGSVATIFFGGGTPTMLPVKLLTEMLDMCRRIFSMKEDPEISLEVNPATVNQDDLRQLFQAGFNRLSIGAQSLSDRDLLTLGRPHTAAAVRDTVEMGRKAGFANLSLDLMYGLPGQTVTGWGDVLERALRLQPDHLSLYELTVESGTLFAEQQEQGKLLLPQEDQVLEMMDLTMSEMMKRGFHRYEISNYALAGKECLHNINYWRNGSYIGAGAGAVSCLSGCRKRAVEDVEEFCEMVESGRDPWIDSEELDLEASFRETVIMGLRMIAGISIPELRERFGIDLVSYYGTILTGLQDQGLVILEHDRIRLSPSGLLVANSVMAELV